MENKESVNISEKTNEKPTIASLGNLMNEITNTKEGEDFLITSNIEEVAKKINIAEIKKSLNKHLQLA